MKKHPIFFMIVILLFMAMACNFGGGDDADEAESSSETTGNSESSDSPGPATAAAKELESEKESESAADESNPEATPSLAPTPTEETPPTEEPPAEPAAEATEASMEDQGSGSSSGSAGAGAAGSGNDGASGSSDAWGESGSGQQTACDHPYFPMRTGSTWTFVNGADTMVWVITDVQGDLDNASAMMTNTIDNVVIEYKWDCSSENGLSSFDFATLGIQDLGTEVTMDNMVLEGTFLLPADQLELGAAWNLVLDGVLNISQEAGGQTMEITANMVSDQNFTVAGSDPVTFENQTVDGLQIEESNLISILMNVAGTEVAQDVSIGSLLQLGRGIGIIRQDYTSDFGAETQELISFYIP